MFFPPILDSDLPNRYLLLSNGAKNHQLPNRNDNNKITRFPHPASPFNFHKKNRSFEKPLSFSEIPKSHFNSSIKTSKALRQISFHAKIRTPDMEPSSPPQDLLEYSASSTTIGFDRPIPLLRGPVRAGPGDDPSAGPYVLAFRDARAWHSAYRACESKIAGQCEAGARIGCAITASSKCKPPWWRTVVGGFRVSDLKEREECEGREMKGCLAAAKEKCGGFARERCLKSFRDARIAAGVGDLSPKQAEKLVCWTTMADNKSLWIDLVGLKRLVCSGLSDREFGATNYTATELLGSCADVDSILGGTSGIESSKL